ncbi:MAG TPA: lipase [Actinocatenispora sp.]
MTTHRTRLRRTVGALLVGLAVTVGPATAATARSALTTDTRLALPAPTGPRRVGVETLHLVDPHRTDPWVPSSGPRQLMVTMRYPATAGPPRSGPPARYVTPTESAAFLAAQHVTGVPPDALSHTRTYGTVGASPLPGRRPLVVLSPGFSLPASSLTALAEDLASQGYVVAAVDHTYESVATTFPDGHVTDCVACSTTDGAKIARGRVADLRFVLDRLTGRHPAWRYADRIDPTRIATAGHSIGGAAASATMVADRRVDAGVNLDGTPQIPLPASGLSRPFLMVGAAENHVPGADRKWDTEWSRLTGWRRWLTVTGSAHFTFTDYPLLADQLGIPPVSSVPGARSVRITRAYVSAFLREHLRGAPDPLLAGPSPTYPEVVFQP